MKLIYILELFLVWRLIWERHYFLTACHGHTGILRVLLEWKERKTEACPQGKIQPAEGKTSICSFIHHIFIKYFLLAKLSARAGDIKSRPISALKDLTVKCWRQISKKPL